MSNAYKIILGATVVVCVTIIAITLFVQRKDTAPGTEANEPAAVSGNTPPAPGTPESPGAPESSSTPGSTPGPSGHVTASGYGATGTSGSELSARPRESAAMGAGWPAATQPSASAGASGLARPGSALSGNTTTDPSWNTGTRELTNQTSRTYTIKSGDTFESIARTVYGTERRWEDISRANQLVDPKRLKIGQVIRLPQIDSSPRTGATSDLGARSTPESSSSPRAAAGSGEHIVRAGETLSSIARQHYNNPGLWRRIYEANRETIGPRPGDLEVGMKLRIPSVTRP